MNEIEDLQIRISFQEDSLQELNLTVARQQNELAILRKELARLMDRLLELERNQPGESGDGGAELPPHY
ncbi:SlyX family protein [Thiolapillus sp.]